MVVVNTTCVNIRIIIWEGMIDIIIYANDASNDVKKYDVGKDEENITEAYRLRQYERWIA